ncbi:MAG: TRAP transporter small permease subunit [Deltaproteobacteria bacterium]|nr:TRAP transporter small permease subunit [Deltaproteobacteria bacterium]
MMSRYIMGFFNAAAKAADWMSLFLLSLITVQLIIVVILRYVFLVNIRWFEQSSTLLFFYLVFIPAGLLSRNGQHLKMEVLSESLRKSHRQQALRILQIATKGVEALFCAIVLYLAWKYTFFLIEVDATYYFEFFGRRVPQWTTSAALILGFFFLLLHTLEGLIVSAIQKKS